MKTFWRNESGGVAILFSVASLVAFGMVGLAVDMSRANSVKGDLGHALDAAALAGGQLETGDRFAAAQKAFAANYRGQAMVNEFKAFVAKTEPYEVFRTEALVTVPSTISRVLGFSQFPIRSFSEVVRGNDANLHIALALDVTGSMKGNRLTALKASSAEMINTMFTNLKRNDQVKFSIVPFARYVNVGLGVRSQSWLSVPDDYSVTKYTCTTSKPVIREYNCKTTTSTKYSDGIPYESKSTVCEKEYGQSVTTCGDKTTNYKWNGCVGSRNSPLDTLDGQYVTRIPGLMNTSCNVAVQPLSSNKGQLIKTINSLAASDETYMPSGLVWGWRTLSPGEPFDDGADPSRVTNRYLILMTDGVNTLSPNYPTHNGNNRTLADKLTADLCRNIKESGITIFSIAFEVTDIGVKNMLQTCASGSDRFFDASDAVQLSSTFKSIATQLLALRIAR
ncbi:MAG: putative Flp pilus-assembly TadE/G [Hyphomicrobiales bacterium]|nr:putative Flp pilus-assembly TadE/G [Hyphomicrobiales bacterium]